MDTLDRLFTDQFPVPAPAAQPIDIDPPWARLPEILTRPSLVETRENVSTVQRILSQMRLETITDANGDVWNVIARRAGKGEFLRVGFQVYENADDPGDNKVSVWPSIISGLGSAAEIPKMNRISLDADTPPKMTLEPGHWIAIYVEAEPAAEETTVDEDVTVWRVVDGSGEIKLPYEIRTYSSSTAMNDASVPATVDNGTGATTAGKFVIPLAKRNQSTGLLDQLGHIGPIGVRLCANGVLLTYGPARAIYQPYDPSA